MWTLASHTFTAAGLFEKFKALWANLRRALGAFADKSVKNRPSWTALDDTLALAFCEIPCEADWACLRYADTLTATLVPNCRVGFSVQFDVGAVMGWIALAFTSVEIPKFVV